ncbi:MAG: hypothetical protein OEV00_12440 [Acidobacteriota bacterium]|nr:hypothetical protein [Acidobacteriota bacterium]MDH3786120.1 hypothetical protein [Acidobacteriota bacterium]
MRHLLPLLLISLTLSCGGPTDEDRIRNLIADGEAAAEAGNLRALTSLLDENYSDAEGRDKRAVVGMLALYLQQTPAPHVATGIRRIEIDSANEARAVVVVAVTDTLWTDPRNLRELRADLQTLNLRLIRRSGRPWRIVAVEAKPAEVSDLIDLLR